MEKNGKQLFEMDRKMELKVRLAVRHAHKDRKLSALRSLDIPEKETLDRLIARVRSL